MAILKVIIRKMLNNRWLSGSLFLGLMITVSLVSSIPTYTSSVMHKVLLKELEDYQINQHVFPGQFTFLDTFSQVIVPHPKEALEQVEKIKDSITKDTKLPILADVNVIATSPLKVMFDDNAKNLISQKAGRLVMLTNFEKHITLTDGKLPGQNASNGIIDVLVSEKALEERDMVLGSVFSVGEDKNQFLIRPIGTFKFKNDRDPYWALIQNDFSADFIVNENLFKSEIINKHEGILGTVQFSTAFDYHQINEAQIPALLNLKNQLTAEISDVKPSSLLVKFPIQDILNLYGEREHQLTIMLWALNAPVLVMLALYLFMVSRLIVGRQLNEIAILSSRGASRSKIVFIHFIEITILGVLAFLVGPYIGLLLVDVLGASNGFLEFVERSALPVKVMPQAFVYAFFAVIASIVMIMIPVFQSSKQSIVNHKQNLARAAGSKQWYTIFIDLSLLGIAIYGLTSFIRRENDIQSLSIDNGDLYIDPTLFFLPAFFIIGLGLLILRIYPWVLKGIYKLGEKFWPVSLYTTFIQVSRSFAQYQFLMLFLVMTIGIGMFSASAARTINNNLEEQIMYENGADVRVDVRWNSNIPESLPVYSTPGSNSGASNANNSTTPPDEVVYSEPIFEPFMKLEGVEHATKVFNKENIVITGKGRTMNGSKLMAIEPKEFGETAWFKPSLLPYHWYQYLNLIAKEPSAVLITRNIADTLGVKTGDYVSLFWQGSDKAEFVVYGIIDYWPSFNPLEKNEDNNSDASLIVSNLPYVQNTMGLEPYQVWMKLKPGTKTADFYNSIKKLKIPITSMEDVSPNIIDLKNSSLLLGLNGTMTLGFLISLFVSLIGFLLYWVLTIKSRTLQYGVYRAMGMPMPKLISILIWEQVGTSGFACVLGIIIGKITSNLFVPLFKLSLNPQKLVPPFQVVFNIGDEMKIYLFVSMMLLIGVTFLVIFLKKIKIHQAIKLGED